MKLHKLIQRASAAAVASTMILSVTLPTLAAAPDGTGNAAVADMVSLTNGTAALSEEDEGRDTGITVNGQSVLVNSTVVDNIPIQFTSGTDASTLTILQAVAGDLTIKVNPTAAGEVTANWELYTGSEPTVFWEYYTYSGLLTPDNTPQNPADMSNMTVSYDSASRTYTVDLKDDLWSPVDFKGNENPNIKVKGELGNSVHISGANNVSVDIDSQNEETNLNVDCAGTLRLKNNTGNSPLELKLTYKQAEGAGYTVVLDGEKLEETPAYENATVSLNESLTIIPNISDPIPDDSSAGGDSSDAAGALVAAAVAGAAVFGGYTIITELMLQDLLPEGAAIPKNQAQLAKLVWQTAGFPEPENASAFANMTDPETAKAAQWCVEQGYLDADFDPDRWTPKFKVIQTWNKAFPKQ